MREKQQKNTISERTEKWNLSLLSFSKVLVVFTMATDVFANCTH